MITKKVSKTLFINKFCHVKIHLKTFDDKANSEETFHNMYQFGNSEYMNLTLSSFITIEVRGDGGEWEPDRSLFINDHNHYHLLKGMEKVIESMYNPELDLFYKDENNNMELKVVKEVAEEQAQRLFNLGFNQRAILVPAVVFDEMDNTSYEGVTFCINNSSNVFQLTIDEFETLYSKLVKVDFFVYAKILYDMYISIVKEEKVNKTHYENKAYRAKKDLFTEQPQTTSTLIKRESDEDFFGIG